MSLRCDVAPAFLNGSMEWTFRIYFNMVRIFLIGRSHCSQFFDYVVLRLAQNLDKLDPLQICRAKFQWDLVWWSCLPNCWTISFILWIWKQFIPKRANGACKAGMSSMLGETALCQRCWPSDQLYVPIFDINRLLSEFCYSSNMDLSDCCPTQPTRLFLLQLIISVFEPFLGLLCL